jgi:hypothetical protein
MSWKQFRLLIFLFISVAPMLAGQENAADRRKWLDEQTAVSNDPRRIPVPPVPQGPDGTLFATQSRKPSLRPRK